MTLSTDRQMAALRQALNQDPTLSEQLPAQEGDIVRRALAGEDIHVIAQQLRLPEAAIWEVLGNAARLASRQGQERVETAGLGSDTDPGATGGYGDTGFGALGNDPPFPTPEEPSLSESDEAIEP